MIGFIYWSTDIIDTSLSYLEVMPEVQYKFENGTLVNSTLTYEICNNYEYKILKEFKHSWVSEYKIEWLLQLLIYYETSKKV